MNILLHDYAGHPFQVGLSRHLAARGHAVTHAYCAADHGPKGWFDRPGPSSLRFIAVSHANAPPRQTALLARRFDQIAYGREVVRLIKSLRPDVVMSGNTPTEAQGQILEACRTVEARFVYWVQDIYSIGVSRLLSRRLGPLGGAVGAYYRRLDRSQYRRSDAVVVIADEFRDIAAAWTNDPAKVHVIENWGALGDIPQHYKANAWSRRHGFDERFCFLYSGTLGRKHRPDLLAALAAAHPDDAVAVVGQGVGVDDLRAACDAQALRNLRTLPLQPAAVLPGVLGAADVLVASVEADAGSFCVPSKILSYLCAGRPILLSAPLQNLAARTVQRAKAGIVVAPGDQKGFLDAARLLRENHEVCARMGANGRAYAEHTFDLDRITDRFEVILTGHATRLVRTEAA